METEYRVNDRRKSAGFTLAELMIVGAVIAVFASMAIPATDGWVVVST